MQVKKFEAKTMKEALELVKVHLGPEAIILSAKDTHRGFGLIGEKSVEVTAAVSEETLRKKRIAEAKMREELRERFQQIPAAQQKEYINKAFKTKSERVAVMAGDATPAVRPTVSAESRAQVKGMRYIDIGDEEMEARSNYVVQTRPQPIYQQAQAELPSAIPRPRRSARVSAAAAAAASAAQATFAARPAQASVAAAVAATEPQEIKSSEVRALESQVRELRALVEKFQKIPQIPLTMHPGAEQGLSFELSGIYQRLTGQGVLPHLATSILKKAQKELDPETLKKPALIDAWVVRHLLNTVEVSPNPTSSRYHVFVGSSGQGKTTTLVKFASHLMLKEKRSIAVISLDTLKLGAADQLRLYAQILNVPFALVRSPEEWAVADSRLSRVNHILVDAPGLSLARPQEREWLRAMLPPANINKSTHFVQSVLARDEETAEIAARYQVLGFNDVIFTRLDEASRQGALLNFQERFQVPLHSFSMGTRIPEDFEMASKERVVDFLFGISKPYRKEEPA